MFGLGKSSIPEVDEPPRRKLQTRDLGRDLGSARSEIMNHYGTLLWTHIISSTKRKQRLEKCKRSH